MNLAARARDERAYTLVELLIGVLIIGVLASLVAPGRRSSTAPAWPMSK